VSLELVIVTPEREAFRGPVKRVVLPGSEGEFGVLEGHERFLCPLRIGEVEIDGEGEPRFAALSDGFADVGESSVVVMVDTCELAEEIDVARAERARARAEEALARLHEGTPESDSNFRHAQAALQRALVRLQVAARRAR